MNKTSHSLAAQPRGRKTERVGGLRETPDASPGNAPTRFLQV